MRELKLTKDANNLFHFLVKYPNQWHSFGLDTRTKKALERVKKAFPSNINISATTNQIRLNLSPQEMLTARRYASRFIKKNPFPKKGKRKHVRFIYNPKKARETFTKKFLSDPFYSEIYRRAVQRFADDLKAGHFNKKKWIAELKNVAERVAKEHGITLSHLDKIKIAIKLAQRAWNKLTR